MEDTAPVTAPRTAWAGLLEISRQSDMSLFDRIMSVGVVEADYDTKPFLALRLKLIKAIQSCYEAEGLQKLGGNAEKEETAEVDLTIGEATYLDVQVTITAFKGALTLKRDLWRAIAALHAKHRKEREAL